MRACTRVIVLALLGGLALTATAAEATRTKEYGKKHKIFYHLNEPGTAKAIAVLTNIQNHVDTVGWRNIEAPAGGLRIDACPIMLKRQKVNLRDLLEGLTAVPSSVARVMELQELGYAYVKP